MDAGKVLVSLLTQLIRDEDNRQFPYDDDDGATLIRGCTLRGNISIGVGRNLSAKGLSQEERRFLLQNDIADASRELEQHFPWTSGLDGVRRDALVNMFFNEGVGHLAGFVHFLAALKAGDYKLARDHMLDSLWATQVGPRAQRLAIQIDTGVEQ